MGFFGKKKEASSEIESLSVIALANDGTALQSVFDSLTKYDYQTKLVSEVSSFITALEDFEPDIILVSLNLKNTDAVQVISVLQSLDLPVIGFGETDDEETCLRLLKTELHHVIIPPMTFESFMERVEFLAMEKELIAGGEDTKSGAEPFVQPHWGKVIQLLNEKLLDIGKTIFQSRNSGDLGSTEIKFAELVQIDDGDLQIGKKLDVDVFIAMPLNHKCILYLRRGCVLVKENMDRLQRYGKARVLKRRVGARAG